MGREWETRNVWSLNADQAEKGAIWTLTKRRNVWSLNADQAEKSISPMASQRRPTTILLGIECNSIQKKRSRMQFVCKIIWEESFYAPRRGGWSLGAGGQIRWWHRINSLHVHDSHPIFTRMNRQAAITILCKPQHNEAATNKKKCNSREQDHPIKNNRSLAHHYTSQCKAAEEGARSTDELDLPVVPHH
jgi:hypothetical protein